ncbi:hypothetical protein AKL17_1094 [Frigidibacter mobilis]|uniref:Oxidoreductase molybdopterin-binding domain-containing protein n=2 Tax=Frigidibacter mobilis TaxID=1335048 RepID=A0A159Z0G4_9RHOB|nr:hypothetical protein AKL17_1094 [Frigidibacter mobilis]
MVTSQGRPQTSGPAGLARRQVLAAGAAMLLHPGAARAAHHDLLTIASKAGEVVLSRADLEALPQHSFVTTTIWTAEALTFSGPSLQAVLAAAGIVTGKVELIAINDYRVVINVTELGAEAPILATRLNGQPFSRRQKGPLWLVYPYDSDPAFQNEIVYARSIWQIVRIQSMPE